MATADHPLWGKSPVTTTRGAASRGLLIAIIACVLIAGGVGAVMYFSPATQAVSAKAGEEPKTDQTYYFDLDPSFIVNFIYKDTLRYLQINMSVMARDPEVIEMVEHHMPAIRHQLLVMLSDKSYAELSGPASKEKLRLEMLIAVRKIIGNSTSGRSVDALYITGYVMQ